MIRRVLYLAFALLMVDVVCCAAPVANEPDSTVIGGRVVHFDEAWLRSLRKPKESLKTALEHHYGLNARVAQVFYVLAASNTHGFTNREMMKANNLYCLCDENNTSRYYNYAHWSESVTEILSIYRGELGEDFNDLTLLLDCIAAHYDREKLHDMSRYHEYYFGNALPMRRLNKKDNGGLPW